MKLTVALLCAAVLTTASACRKKPEVVAAPQPTPAAPTGNEAQMAESNATILTEMLQQFAAKNGRLPNEVSELDSIKGYGPITKPPAGYRYVIDAKKKTVVAVKQ